MKISNWLPLFLLGGLIALGTSIKADAVGTCNMTGNTLNVTGQTNLGSNLNSPISIDGKPITITGHATNGGDQITDVSVNGLFNVQTYGAKGDGSSDDTAAIQAAVNAAMTAANLGPAYGGGVPPKSCVYFPSGNYVVKTDLNFTSPAAGIGGAKAFCVRGEDPASTNILCEDTGGNCLDASGADGYSISNISFQGGTSSANAPKNILLLARMGSTGFGHTLTNVWMATNGIHTIYDYGAEIAGWTNVRSNSTGAVVISACNKEGVTSAFQTLPAPPTSMSAVTIYGGIFNAGNGGCAITLDNACATQANIRDISIAGVFFGEMNGGGAALCDKAGGTNPTLYNISVKDVRLEVFDQSNTGYKFIDFTKGNSYVWRLVLSNIEWGVNAVSAGPILNFGGFIDNSQLEIDFANSSTYILSGPGGRANRITGLTPNQIAPAFIYGGGGPAGCAPNCGTEGNYISYFDGSNGYGHTDAGGVDGNTMPVIVNGTTAGDVQWSMPVHAANWKTVMLAFQGYENTTAGYQTIALPLSFQITPSTYGSCPAGLTFNLSQIGLPISMSTGFTGNCFLTGF